MIKESKSYKKAQYGESLLSKVTSSDSEWKAFLYSGVLLRWSKEERENFLDGVLKGVGKESQRVVAEYLLFEFSIMDRYKEKARASAKGINAEDVLCFLEYACVRMLVKRISVDGKSYPEDIVNSQHEHLLSTLPSLIKFLIESGVPFEGERSCKKQGGSKSIIESMSHVFSIEQHVVEVLKGCYVPRHPCFLLKKYDLTVEQKDNIVDGCKYFLERQPVSFNKLETYRDLNYGLECAHENDEEKLFSLMESSGFSKYDSGMDCLYFDFGRGEAFNEEVQFYKVGDMLRQIYGSLSLKIEVDEEDYSLYELVEFSRKVYRLAKSHNERNKSNLKAKKSGFILTRGRKSLVREFSLNHRTGKLLDIFCVDLEEGRVSDVANFPLFSANGLYYLVPSHVVELCFEKVVDKAVTRPGVTVRFPAREKKGGVFEKKIMDLFSKAGHVCSSIKRNERKKVPEIDVVVDFKDDFLFLIEAKCTIKPESRFESFSFIENHLSKAVEQLSTRFDFLTKRSDEAEERLPFCIQGKKILPIIVTNHSYFTGMKLVAESGVAVHCIDVALLEKIISCGFIPCWSYVEGEGRYFLRERRLKSGGDFVNALIDPLRNLNGMAGPTVQVSEHGVAFEIFKPAQINWDNLYENNDFNQLSQI